MSDRRAGKLNQLQSLLPEGLLASAAWLEKKGYSQPLRSQYVSSGWLDSPARGVYRRPGGELQWQHVVVSLQYLLEIPVTVGGRTALELHGFTHYVSDHGPTEIHLYSNRSLPGWVGKLTLSSHFVYHNAKKLFREEPIARGLGHANWNWADDLLESNDAIHGAMTQIAWGQWNWPITLSTPERAILELLDELPKRETFHQVDMLMEGLRTLSPRRLQKLLEDCRSVKVKRLFLWFAERHDFRWLKQIQVDRIDLGKGKRQIVRGGRLDTKYLITVPEDMSDGG